MTRTPAATLGTGPASGQTLGPEELHRLEAAVLAIVRGVLAGHHQFESRMDKAGYVTLSALHRLGEMRQTDLASRMGVDLSTVSRQVKSLEEMGFVKRTVVPEDRRASVLAVTAAGRREIAKQRQARWSPVAERLADIPVDERGRFIGFLEQLADLSTSPTVRTTGKAQR